MGVVNDVRQVFTKALLDCCNFTVKLPLSDKTKNIQPNTFVYIEPLPHMKYMHRIYALMGQKEATRWVYYRKGFWYVKSVKINYTSSEQTMTLELSPLPNIPSTQSLEVKEKQANMDRNSNTTYNSSDSLNLNPPSWLSKDDKDWAVSIVKKAVGTEKRQLQQAQLIYNYFKDHYRYEYYSNLRHTSKTGNRRKAWIRGSGNCADGANLLETLYLTAGINSRIKHVPNHYIIKLNIANHVYWVDNRKTKKWNTVWNGKTGESESNITNGQYING